MPQTLDSLTRDLPPWPVSRSASHLGFLDPLDRPWHRVDWSDSPRVRVICPCQPYAMLRLAEGYHPTQEIRLTEMEKFSLVTSKTRSRVAKVLIGQCPCCETMLYALKDEDLGEH